MHDKSRPEQRTDATWAQEKPSSSLLISAQRPGLRSIILLRGLRKARRSLAQAKNEEQVLSSYLKEAQKHFESSRIGIAIAGAAFGRAGILRVSSHAWQNPNADQIRLTKDAVQDIEFGSDVRTEPAVSISDDYTPVMEAEHNLREGAVDGFDVPIVIGDRVIGALYIEMSALARPSSALLESAHIIAEHLAGTLCIHQFTRQSAEITDYVRKFLNFANVPVLAIGPDRSIRVASPAFARIQGGSAGQLVGRDFLTLVPEPERVRLLSAFTNASNGHEAQPMEVHILREHRSEAVMRMKLTPILDAEQSVSGIMIIGTDITEMRALENQVVHAERLATLGKLAAGIVHEINNPLSSIRLYSDLLLRRNIGDPADQERLHRIAQASERILHFTRGLVAYARPSRERPEQLDLNQIIDESIAFCEHVIHEKQVKIVKDLAPELPAVEGVRTNLHQVFINLITNACQAVPSGGELRVRTSRGADGSVFANIKDNGPGISPHQIDHIFDPFYSTKPEGEGTGLGLPIAKSIVEQHAGRIDVETVLGGGATFVVCLPQAR